jgi:hypothetical protein
MGDWLLIGRWVAKLLARLLATALWVGIRHSSKIQNGRHKQGSVRHTQARQKIKPKHY